jgi:hypothetical protein
MDNHTCQYCDGTLMSVRPVCVNCGHALCQEIRKNKIMKVHDYILGFPRHIEVTVNETICPRCQALNVLDDSYSTVTMMARYLGDD